MTDNPNKIVTRFAPSPTGKFHVGGIRTALYNYLFARKHGGTFILRSEDTDPIRSKKEYEDYFLELFKWLELDYDQFFRQSERTAIFRSYIERLIKEDKAYISKEEPREAGQRSEVIRLRNPGKIVTFHDEVLGDISVDTTDLGDFVLARELDSPVYHFTVVIDDFEMGVTHIIRGQEHVSNTPRQILIQEAIGAPRPIYAHASVILNNERAKLSKRDPLVRPALEYRDEGYLAIGMLNFMSLLGWNPGTEQEIFSKDELIEAFSLERLQKPGAIFNPDKLAWVNKEHIKRLTREAQEAELVKYLPEGVTAHPHFNEAFPLFAHQLIERISHFGEVKALIEAGEIDFYLDRPKINKEQLYWKNEQDPLQIRRRLERVSTLIASLPSKNTPDEVKAALWSYAEEEGRGQVLWPTRVALSGKEKSPDPFTLVAQLGRDESLARIKDALTVLS
jgi:glutamyl-tRNA synthetase